MTRLIFKPVKGDVEDPEEYRRGGFHPVHLGETLKEKRYEIRRKLGYGAFSTIWLAWDILAQSEVALKIAKADAGRHELEVLLCMRQHPLGHQCRDHVLGMLDHFEHVGPNGTHQCLVLDVMDGSLNCRKAYPPAVVKEISRQVAMGLDFIHKCGIIHSDLYPANIMFRKTLYSQYRKTRHKTQTILTLERNDGFKNTHSPRYLVDHTVYYDSDSDDEDEWESLDTSKLEIKIGDFGVAFMANDPPQRFYTPISFRAPEQFIPLAAVDQKLDIWSFACNIYQWITQSPLFPVFVLGKLNDEDCKDMLLNMRDKIGSMPKNMLSQWPGATDFTTDQLHDDRFYRQLPLAQSLTDHAQYDFRTKSTKIKKRALHMTTSEISNLNDMLSRMLTYEPRQRIQASQLLRHPWLK